MRVVGLLLISALMIIPVATAQLVARSFRTTVALAMALGAASRRSSGVWISYETDTPSGGTIVLTAIGAFLLVATTGASAGRPHPRSSAMCMQCVAEGVTYVGGAVGALQVLKVRARASAPPTDREAPTWADRPATTHERTRMAHAHHDHSIGPAATALLPPDPMGARRHRGGSSRWRRRRRAAPAARRRTADARRGAGLHGRAGPCHGHPRPHRAVPGHRGSRRDPVRPTSSSGSPAGPRQGEEGAFQISATDSAAEIHEGDRLSSTTSRTTHRSSGTSSRTSSEGGRSSCWPCCSRSPCWSSGAGRACGRSSRSG